VEDQAANLRRAARRQLETPARAGGGCRVLAVSGGKGGVGKTNIAVNLSLALCEQGARVLLLDADLGLANVDLLLGLAPQRTLQHVLRGEAELEEIVLHGPLGLHVLPGSIGLPEMANLAPLDIVRLLGALRRLEERHDWLVIDTAAGIGQSVIRFAQAADEILIVTTPEPTAILDAFGLIKSLHGPRRDNQLSLLVNMLRQRSELLETHRSLATVAARYCGVPLRLLGGLPLDDAVSQCVKLHRPFLIEQPAAPAAAAVRAVAAALLAQPNLPSPPQAGYFSRMLTR
jgi:flagellar biosynthesis protein FlhG